MTVADLRHIVYVVLLAASPLAEMRGSIPVGIAAFKMSVVSVVFWSILGNMIVFFAIYGLGEAWLRLMEKKQHFLARLTERIVHHSRKKFEAQMQKYGLIAFPFIVAVPLPFFGMWTGALAAFLVGVPYKKALPLAFLGAVVGAFLILAGTVGSVALFAKA